MPRLAVTTDLRIVALVGEDKIVDVGDLLPGWTENLRPDQVGACLAGYAHVAEEIRCLLASGARTRPLATVELAAPIPKPRTVFAVPVNFRAHAGELGTRSPQSDTLDARQLGLIVVAPDSVVGPSGAIELPDLPGRDFHYEGEVAVVIGRRAAGVTTSEALDHVLGYTGALDVTLRLSDGAAEDRSMRKSFATFTPLGPVLLTADEVPDPRELCLRLTINGELRQQGCLRDLVVGVEELVALASSVVALEPGDVIATGTPSGVGRIEPGDVVALDVTGVGELRMPVRRREW